MLLRALLLLICAVALVGCPADTATPEPAKAPAKTPAKADPPTDGASHAAPSTQVYDVVCGCAIEAVGHCGEYAKIEGAFVEIVGDHGLGDMPFCGKTGLKAEVSGHPSKGKLHAHSVKLVE